MAKRAIISVSNKEGIVELARGLLELGWEIVSTGGTAQALRAAGIQVTYISDVTGFPEILDGRVKTLHPKVHGGILARRTPEHLTELEAQGIIPIDLVVVNLYPFQATVAKPQVTLEEAVENIDIGGPTMVRAAAKNFESVAIVVNPKRYPQVLAEIREQGEVTLATRRRLALEAFQHTAQYDAAISAYLEQAFREVEAARAETRVQAAEGETIFPEVLTFSAAKVQDLRYGENPHQKAAFYRLMKAPAWTVTGAQQLQGKELSYNNIVDVQAAWELVRELKPPAAVIIKHTNPCGAALGKTLFEAYTKAYAADSVSAFGGIVGLNVPVDRETAEKMAETFLEAVIAPDFEPEALEVLSAKKNLRLLRTGSLGEGQSLPGFDIKSVGGGLLVQEWDQARTTAADLKVVTEKAPTPEQVEELLFAWTVVKHVKSNAIVVTKGGVTLGVGAGQMNRVGAAKIALEQAGEQARGAVLASDAFFPFPDTVEEAARAEIAAIIQPGGSVRDQEAIDTANRYGLAMVFTGQRHFRHG